MSEEQLNSWDDPVSPLSHHLHAQLAGAAELLDAACQLINDRDFDRSENLRKIGEALSRIFEIQHQIYERRPDIKPSWLNAPGASSGSLTDPSDRALEANNGLLTSIFIIDGVVSHLEQAGLGTAENLGRITAAKEEIRLICETIYESRPDLKPSAGA